MEICFTRDISQLLLHNDYEKRKAIPSKQINEAAAQLLKENTKSLEKIPNVENFIKQ